MARPYAGGPTKMGPTKRGRQNLRRKNIQDANRPALHTRTVPDSAAVHRTEPRSNEMATLRTEFEIAADAADIWAVIRRFDTGPVRMAPGFVTECAADGDHRLVTFANGTVVRERLVSVDEERMRIAYSVVGGDATPDHDNAVMRVIPLGPGRSRFVWSRDLLPAEMSTGYLAAMRAGGEHIKRTFETQHDQASRVGS